MPAVGFASPTAPRWLSTLTAREEELVTVGMDSEVHHAVKAVSAGPPGVSG
jgi:hypothetical protein